VSMSSPYAYARSRGKRASLPAVSFLHFNVRPSPTPIYNGGSAKREGNMCKRTVPISKVSGTKGRLSPFVTHRGIAKTKRRMRQQEAWTFFS